MRPTSWEARSHDSTARRRLLSIWCWEPNREPQTNTPLALTRGREQFVHYRAAGHSAGQQCTFGGGLMGNRLVAEALGTFWIVFAG